jgi:integrase
LGHFVFKAGQTRRVFWTAQQIRPILELVLEPWHTIFAMAAMTGLRPGEVPGPSIDDLDFEQRLILCPAVSG